jgi:predicted transcriptional regulator
MFLQCMKAITINVSEPVYREFQRYATALDRTTSELIREAMEDYLDRKLSRRTSLKDLEPVSLGRVLRDTAERGDLLAEMRDDDRN